MPVLKVEHFACNVSGPDVAAGYVEHFGMRILRRNDRQHRLLDDLHLDRLQSASGRCPQAHERVHNSQPSRCVVPSREIAAHQLQTVDSNDRSQIVNRTFRCGSLSAGAFDTEP